MATSPDDDGAADDPFSPFHDVADAESDPEARLITARAVILGGLSGALVNAANIYLGLKTGWTSSANILGAIIGFSVLKKWDPGFGPHENNIVQTVATAAGGMSNVFTSAIPALYQLGLMQTPVKDFLRIVTLTAIGGYFGLLSIAPLRGFFIRDVARELNLIFPSSTATAITIRSMHSAASGAKTGRGRMKGILLAFAAAMMLRIVSQYAVGVFWEWHPFAWLVHANVFATGAVMAESWGWVLEWSPAMFGSGMIVDANVAISFFLGSIVAWGVLGPYLVANDLASGESISREPRWTGLMSYTSMSTKFANPSHPSPRYWLLWPGVATMLAVAFIEIACQWRVLWVLAKNSVEAARSAVSMMRGDTDRQSYDYTALDEQDDGSEGNQQIATKMWAPGLFILVVLGCIATKLQFDMGILETLLSLTLAFVLSLVAIQATGATDTTPLTAVSKVSQVLLGATTKGPSDVDVRHSQQLNLLGGGLVSIGASQACDLMGDFRVGFLLKTPTHSQYLAQLIGTLIATFVAPAVFVLFSTAYPCIIAPATPDLEPASQQPSRCEFAGPSVAAWRAVAIAASEPVSPIPDSSKIFSLYLAAAGSVMVLVKHFVLRERYGLAWLRALQPNMMIFALAFTLPSPRYGLTMVMGAAVSYVWRWKRQKEWDRYGMAVAAGLVAGEGIGGTVNCVLSILGVGGHQWGTNVGCPPGGC